MSLPTLKIYRYKDNGTQTFSEGVVHGPKGRTLFRCVFLELPWRNNRVNVSCIPPGVYDVVKSSPRSSSKFKYWHFLVLNVPGRSYIKIHGANHFHQLRGCIAPGSKYTYDFDHDGQPDVVNSRATLQRLINFLPLRFKMEIYDNIQRQPDPIPTPLPTPIPKVKSKSAKKQPVKSWYQSKPKKQNKKKPTKKKNK